MGESTFKLVTVFCHAIAVTLLLTAWLWFSDFLSIEGPQPASNSKTEQVNPLRIGIAF
ncbi:MAG: hypothetical protein AAF329_20670 [Cyanobacteria bacterium P01_A01_bin.17]